MVFYVKPPKLRISQIAVFWSVQNPAICEGLLYYKLFLLISSEPSKNLDQKYKDIEVNPRALDIFHYSFAHSGILTGPYYRFRTFQDLYETPYVNYAECDFAMIKRIIRAPIYIVLFLITGYIFPLKVCLSRYIFHTSRLSVHLLVCHASAFHHVESSRCLIQQFLRG